MYVIRKLKNHSSAPLAPLLERLGMSPARARYLEVGYPFKIADTATMGQVLRASGWYIQCVELIEIEEQITYQFVDI